MLFLTWPPNELPIAEWLSRLRQMAEEDLTTARRTALLRLVWEEAYLTRQGLIARVEAFLGRGCFGPSPCSAFRRDIAAVREALARAGHRLRYSRQRGRRGYYVEGRPHLDERLQHLIAGAVAEVDPRQMAIYRRLEPSQRVWQAAHLSDWLRRVSERRRQWRQAD